MRKALSLTLAAIIIAIAVFSCGCTDPGETLYIDEFYADTPTETPEDSIGDDIEPIPGSPEKSPGDSGEEESEDIEKIPDDIEKTDENKE